MQIICNSFPVWRYHFDAKAVAHAIQSYACLPHLKCICRAKSSECLLWFNAVYGEWTFLLASSLCFLLCLYSWSLSSVRFTVTLNSTVKSISTELNLKVTFCDLSSKISWALESVCWLSEDIHLHIQYICKCDDDIPNWQVRPCWNEVILISFELGVLLTLCVLLFTYI